MTEENTSKSGYRAVKWLLLLLMLGLVVSGIYYATIMRPDIISFARIAVEPLGILPEDPEEVQRRQDINKLPISYEEKQILLNRTIFLGATPRMVMLALGKPKQGQKIDDGKDTVELMYYLPSEPRPTMLRFESGLLTHAYKSSAIEFSDTSNFDGTTN